MSNLSIPCYSGAMIAMIAAALCHCDAAMTVPYSIDSVLQAPAEHEPVLPVDVSVVLCVAGADVIGQPLDEDHVCRAEQVSQLVGAPLGAAVLSEWVGLVAGDRGAWKIPNQVRRWAACLNKTDLVSDEVVAGVAAKVCANWSCFQV